MGAPHPLGRKQSCLGRGSEGAPSSAAGQEANVAGATTASGRSTSLTTSESVYQTNGYEIRDYICCSGCYPLRMAFGEIRDGSNFPASD